MDGKIYTINEEEAGRIMKLWRKREIKIEEGKYKNCGGGGNSRMRRRWGKIKIVEKEGKY